MPNEIGGTSMRLRKREVRDVEMLRTIVEACKVVHIGCIDEEGVFVVPMSFGYEWSMATENATCGGGIATGDEADNVVPGTGTEAEAHLTLWLHCAAEGRKARAWAENPHVAIEMDCEDGLITGDFACAYSYAFRSIMGTGTLTPVTSPAEKRRGLTRIMEHIAPGSPISYSDQSIERVAVWRLDVERFTGKLRRA